MVTGLMVTGLMVTGLMVRGCSPRGGMFSNYSPITPRFLIFIRI